ncbi:MAG: hypothetical protein NT007_01115 [Candidatus Kapabacteria bacterium]|nr:hypothetical protein [Candidatus Kapabacteria bacterium]
MKDEIIDEIRRFRIQNEENLDKSGESYDEYLLKIQENHKVNLVNFESVVTEKNNVKVA